MALNIRSLADGTVGASVGDLVPAVSSDKAVIVKNMRFVNTGTATRTLNVYFRSTATETDRRNIIPKDLQLAAGCAFVDDQELTLEEGDRIEGSAGVAAEVAYVISGVEKDQA